MMYFVECRSTLTKRNYGPFSSMDVVNLWLKSHAPTSSYLMHNMCDNGVHRHNHKVNTLNDPMRGISKNAEVDVQHALTGE